MILADCHPNRKHKARGLCAPCYEAWLKETNPDYKAKQKANHTRWSQQNPGMQKEYVSAKTRKMRCDPVYREKVKRSSRNSLLKRKYGITLVDYEQMLQNQNGGCAICGRKPGKTPLHTDHCHEDGRVRGLLCHQCNWYLGTLEASPQVLCNLLAYLWRNECPAFMIFWKRVIMFTGSSRITLALRRLSKK